MDWLVQGTVGIGVAITVWFLTTRVEAIRRERGKLQDDRRKAYMEILEPMIRMLTGVKNPSETQKALKQVVSFEYRKACFELNLVGSDDVVHSVNSFMQGIYRMGDAWKSSDTPELLELWAEILIAIRRDLGNKKTKLKGVDMLKSMIRDIDDHMA